MMRELKVLEAKTEQIKQLSAIESGKIEETVAWNYNDERST